MVGYGADSWYASSYDSGGMHGALHSVEWEYIDFVSTALCYSDL
jgi:hypothetical protein